MNYPTFFDEVEPIETIDPLADILGAVENGLIVYRYVDMVKFAGHSCPTVAGAWLMCKIGLKELYKDELPIRGDIKVEIRKDLKTDVAGVIGSCIGFITAAANEGGFKGLNGKMARDNRLFYGVKMDKDVRLTRLDTKDSVELSYDPSIVSISPKQQQLMQKIMQETATLEDKKDFKKLWQERVEKILLQRELWSQMVSVKLKCS